THAVLCVNAAPTGIFIRATAFRLFFGIVALTSTFLAIRCVGLDDDLAGGSLDAAPARPAMCSGFLLRSIALKLSLSGFRLRHPNRFSVEADPARPAILDCFFF